jgi:hypothetical protein
LKKKIRKERKRKEKKRKERFQRGETVGNEQQNGAERSWRWVDLKHGVDNMIMII